ncbi:ATP-dependent helicase [Patescibacteria group bacterium]|nr:ATP-dependent helicase [Patescibacteria group bacterium]
MKLNPKQKEAISYQKGPLIIIAGAGTGKTTVITERIKWLINKKGLSPDRILALTFTEKAAKEMEERVDQILPLGYSQLWISTFHSFCDRILRDDLVHIGLNANFKLMSQAETILFLRNHLFDFNFDYFRPNSNPDKFLGGIVDHFSRLADEDITTDQYLQYAKKTSKNLETKDQQLEAQKTKELAGAFLKYQELKEKNGFFDFADLISYTLRLFRQRPNVLENYKKRFAFILVDEFQDTNIAQYQLVKMLAPPEENPNLTVTGDDSQSIYKFRGAAVSNILNFKEDYHQSKMVILTENYRSTQEILDRSYQLIKHNDPDTLESRLGISKNLISGRKAKGNKIRLIFADREENEAETITEEIKKLNQDSNYDYKEIAILVRANNHAEPLIKALLRNNIPYQFLGPSYLFRKREIKDLIAYLKLLIDPADDIAFFKVASQPIFEIDPKMLAEIRIRAKRQNLSFLETAENLVNESESKNPLLLKLVTIFNRHLGLLSKETGGQILYYFLEDSGLIRSLLKPDNRTAHEQATNIAQFFDKIKSFESSNEETTAFHLLDWINLKLEMGESPKAGKDDWNQEEAVNILTVHSSKGLEFPVVFIVNLVNLRFPSTNRREQIPIPQPLIKEFLPEGDAHEQEERRLFYVAMTRAKDILYFTGAKFYGEEAKREKKLSPFAAEAVGEEFGKNTDLIDGIKPDPQISLLSWQKQPEPEKEKIVNPPVNYLSHSQINSFNTCPLQYKYKYQLRLPTFPSGPQTAGNTIHRTLKEFYQEQILENKVLPEKRILKILEENWQSIGFKSKRHEWESKNEAVRMLKDYYQKEVKTKIFPKVAALEQTFSFKINPALKLGGIIDRADILPDNRVEIIDYKTGGNIPDQKQVDNDKQLTLYALATINISQFPFHRPIDRIILSLYFLKENLKISTKRTPEQIDQLRKDIIEIARQIHRSSFPPTPGTPFPCTFCEFKLLCEAWN